MSVKQDSGGEGPAAAAAWGPSPEADGHNPNLLASSAKVPLLWSPLLDLTFSPKENVNGGNKRLKGKKAGASGHGVRPGFYVGAAGTGGIGRGTRRSGVPGAGALREGLAVMSRAVGPASPV